MFFPILIFFVCCTAGSAARNVTLDDNNPAIVYTGRWGPSAQSDLDEGGTYMLTADSNATAVVNFTGVAVYYMSPLWPSNIVRTTQLQLDDQQPVLLSLQDSNTEVGLQETVRSAVVWKAENLSNTAHTLRISVGANQPFAVVDTIIYTVLDTLPSPSFSVQSGTTSIPSTTSTNGASSDNHSSGPGRRVLPKALGAALGALGFFAILFGLWAFCRMKKRSANSDVITSFISTRAESSPLGFLSPDRDNSEYTYSTLRKSSNQQFSGDEPIEMVPIGALPPKNAQPDTYHGQRRALRDLKLKPWASHSESFPPPHHHRYLSSHQSFGSSSEYGLTRVPLAAPGPGTRPNETWHSLTSSASLPSVGQSHDTPSQGTQNPVRFSHTSDISVTATVGTEYQNQHPQHSRRVEPRLESRGNGGRLKPRKEKRPPVSAESRREAVSGSSQPPPYSP